MSSDSRLKGNGTCETQTIESTENETVMAQRAIDIDVCGRQYSFLICHVSITM